MNIEKLESLMKEKEKQHDAVNSRLILLEADNSNFKLQLKEMSENMNKVNKVIEDAIQKTVSTMVASLTTLQNEKEVHMNKQIDAVSNQVATLAQTMSSVRMPAAFQPQNICESSNQKSVSHRNY